MIKNDIVRDISNSDKITIRDIKVRKKEKQVKKVDLEISEILLHIFFM